MMIKILFVCHGNICRSPLCEFLFRHMAEKMGLGDKIYVESAATTYDEIGSDMHRGSKDVLTRHGIPFRKRKARHLEKPDYDRFDYLVGMDDENIRDMSRITGARDKIHKLLEFAGMSRDVRDPWYTHNFDETYDDAVLGCSCLLDEISEKLS